MHFKSPIFNYCIELNKKLKNQFDIMPSMAIRFNGMIGFSSWISRRLGGCT